MFSIVSALKHHKTTVVLVALEIALTCAIVTNALFLIGDRLGVMHLDTGVASNELVWAQTTVLNMGKSAGADDQAAGIEADMAALRGIPGVKSVIMTNTLPLAQLNDWGTILWRRPGDKSSVIDNVTMYVGTSDMVKALGIKLSEGRDFLPHEYAQYTPFGNSRPPDVAIVTSALAHQLWPGQDPLGKPIHIGDNGKDVIHVVGVVRHLLNPRISKGEGMQRSMILPHKAVGGGIYVLQVQPDKRAAVAHAVPRVLKRTDPARIVNAHVYTDTIAKYFHGDRAMIWLLLVVVACLLALTALGVVGLSSFWVQSRTRIIGIRRAIGATRRDILHYFLAENFLIVSLGVVLGCVGAVALNLWLMDHYELHRMPLFWLPIGALILWLLGQLAVLGPALRAARVPPVVATRSV